MRRGLLPLIFMEKWKVIIEFEGYAEVSSLGRVRSVDRIVTYPCGKQVFYPAIIRALYLNSFGYLKIKLNRNNSSKNFPVHRLVASSFIPNPNNYPHVNHINSIRSDNRVENLEWCTPSMNLIHSYKFNDRKSTTGPRKSAYKRHKNYAQCMHTGSIYNFKEAAKFLNLTTAAIYTIARGKEKRNWTNFIFFTKR